MIYVTAESRRKKKNIYFANSKNIITIMYKHRGGFPEGQSPIVLDTLESNACVRICSVTQAMLQDRVPAT